MDHRRQDVLTRHVYGIVLSDEEESIFLLVEAHSYNEARDAAMRAAGRRMKDDMVSYHSDRRAYRRETGRRVTDAGCAFMRA